MYVLNYVQGGAKMPKKRVQEIANEFGVTTMAVYLWIRKGLPYDTKKEIGKKEYKVIDPNDVYKFLRIEKPKKEE
jgi:transposase-like protein